MNQENFIKDKELREKSMDRVEVLEKVKELLLLSGTEFATTEQVAKYFEVGKEAINSLVKDNREEIIQDGFKIFKGKEISQSNVMSFKDFTSNRANFKFTLMDNTILSVGGKGISLFTKRAILRVAMLLRDSEVAKEIRTRLLDIVQDVSEEKDNVLENIVTEISEERQLMLDRVEAEMNGNYEEVSIINAKLFALKNKRIEELEVKLDNITTTSLTIIESRKVINRLTRLIAVKEYKGMFGKAFSELYSLVNYQLGINIKARDKKKNESYLNVLTEKETFDTELIVRSWAEKIGIDVDKELALVG